MQLTPENIRNFALVGHQGCGKTLLAESILACAKVIERKGSIETGTTVSDYHESEKERQISIHSSLLHCMWKDKKLNAIDTPGYFDFISEGLGALRIGDFALIVVDAVKGPELGTDKVWEYATQYNIPKLIVINGLDKEHANFDNVIYELQDHYGSNVFPMTLPINPGPGFNRVLDVLRSEEVDYIDGEPGKYTETEAEGEWKDKVKDLHATLVEYVAEADDTLLEHFFDQGNLSEKELREGVHKAIQQEIFVPVFATSALTDTGVPRLLDMIAKYGSSPMDRKNVTAQNEAGDATTISLSEKQPTCYIWKTISEPHVGELSFCRLYSGEVHKNTTLYNPNRDNEEKIGQLFTLQGHERESIDSIHAGDIGVMVKLRDTHTGNTLTSPDRKVRLTPVVYPKPNIHGTLMVKKRGDEDKLHIGLTTLHEEDPTFIFKNHPETHELVLSGQGELHLEVIIRRMKQRFNVDIDIIEPRVAFRETIQAPAAAKFRHKKQSGGSGQFAEVWLKIKPAERDSGIDFKHSLVGQNVDRVFVPSVEKGIQHACEEGILAGYNVTDVAIDFYDGKMHPVDSKDIAFQVAGKGAFTEAFRDAKPRLLEPILNLKIRMPDSHMGDVMADISTRRGRIQGTDKDGKFMVILAQVPQTELYLYATRLRSITGGTGIHEEEFSHYEFMPHEVEQKFIKK